MYPINQVILGGDSMFSNMDDIDMQIQRMEAYRNKLQQLKSMQAQSQPTKLIWDDIDALYLTYCKSDTLASISTDTSTPGYTSTSRSVS